MTVVGGGEEVTSGACVEGACLLARKHLCLICLSITPLEYYCVGKGFVSEEGALAEV